MAPNCCWVALVDSASPTPCSISPPNRVCLPLSLSWSLCLSFFGSLFILLGVFTRFFAAAALILFLGMIVTVHQQFGFFMNWFGNMKGEGFEYHLLVIGILLPLVISGAGKASFDTLIYKNTYKKQ